MSDAPYTRSELQSFGSELPERGPLCPKCGVQIPQFADLSESQTSRIHHLISNQRTIMVVQLTRIGGNKPMRLRTAPREPRQPEGSTANRL
jgi:hypothetical protein